MVRYVVLLNFTEKGIGGVKESPARAEAFHSAVRNARGKVESLYWTLGSYDGVLVLTAPDDATAAALVLELGKSNDVRSTMLRAFDAGEFNSIVGKIS